MAGPTDERHRTAATLLFGSISLRGGHVRYLVAVRAHRTGDGGGEAGPNQLAVLDKTGCGYSRSYRRCCLHVHPVQGLFESVHAMEGQKQVSERGTAFELNERLILYFSL